MSWLDLGLFVFGFGLMFANWMIAFRLQKHYFAGMMWASKRLADRDLPGDALEVLQRFPVPKSLLYVLLGRTLRREPTSVMLRRPQG